MISIGEETGNVDAMMEKIAGFYEREVNEAIEGLDGCARAHAHRIFRRRGRFYRRGDVLADVCDYGAAERLAHRSYLTPVLVRSNLRNPFWAEVHKGLTELGE